MYPLAPGFTWATQDTTGLAIDMHVRVLPNGTHLVSVRQVDKAAYMTVGQERILLSHVEIPWRTGHLINGKLRFERMPAPAPVLAATPPQSVTTVQLAATDCCVVLTLDQPHLATVAATLYTPDGLDPIQAWLQRLQAYQASVDEPSPTRLSIIGLSDSGDLLCAGGLIPEIGLGGSDDTVPGLVVKTGNQPLRRESWQRRLWVPVRDTDQRWHHDSYVVTLP